MDPAAHETEAHADGFVRGLGLLDATMIVAGSMIGSGIFIVSADIARNVGSPGLLLLTWILTGLLTVAAALSYGELAAMMPNVGGQYVYLREAYSPLLGFLYGWTLFLVIQTGTIAAVAVAFARYLGVLAPAVSETRYLLGPFNLSSGYAISLTTQQLVAIMMVVLLTVINARGLNLGKMIQNTFTITKTAALLGLILVGLLLGYNADAVSANFGHFWEMRDPVTITPDLGRLPAIAASAGLLGVIVAMGVAQVGSLFSSDAWNNITFASAEVRDPRHTLPRAMVLGTVIVIGLYLLANVAYLVTLPITGIQHAAEDRVGAACMHAIFGAPGAAIMAALILVSTFGCNNGLVLAGARVYYAMARDGLFFRGVGRLNQNRVPGVALVLQCIVTALLILPRTRSTDAATGATSYGNLYSNLLDYVVFSVLIFYVLTIAGVFVLRRKRPDAERPYRAWGYPLVPALYIVCAAAICVVLALYKTQTSWPGLAIVLSGIPVYALWRAFARAA
jgi:APA family basic amino acid/polyamine antiporter